MDSFYGGKQGISFVIKDRFISIDDMNQQFANPNYNKTWYHEYCLINTNNLNDPDNGKVFKRTAYRADSDIQNEQGSTNYAEYIGRIRGPAGGVPNVEFGDINEMKNRYEIAASASITPTPSGTIYYKTVSNTYTAVATKATDTAHYYDNLNIQTVTPMTTSTSTYSMYRSGKSYYDPTLEEQQQPQPKFKYGFYTFQSNDSPDGTEYPLATIGIGFEIPYVDFAPPTVAIADDIDSATVSMTKLNDFYYQYNFELPAGQPGPYFGDFEIIKVKDWDDIEVSSDVSYFPPSAVIYDASTGTYTKTATVSPITTFNSSLITVGYFNYINAQGKWTKSSEAFYFGDVSTIEHMTTSPNEDGWDLYVKYGNHDDDNNTEDGYTYVGRTGPASLGAKTIHLKGTYDVNGFRYPISGVTAVETTWTPDQGTLGAISSADVEGETPEGWPNNDVYFYIYTTYKVNENTVSEATVTGWYALGQTSYDAVYFDTNFYSTITFADSHNPFTFIAKPQQENITITPATFEDKPWI